MSGSARIAARRAVTAATRDRIAWYGEIPFVSHFWGLLGIGTIDVSVRLGPALAEAAPERKALAALVRKAVVAGCSQLRREIGYVNARRP